MTQAEAMHKLLPRQVGALDPELKTSSILDEDEEFSLDLKRERPACYFNRVAYPIGPFVLDGKALHLCEERAAFGCAAAGCGPTEAAPPGRRRACAPRSRRLGRHSAQIRATAI